MKIKSNLTFILALIISIGAFFACSKLTDAEKEIKEKVEDVKEKTETTTETTKTEEKSETNTTGGKLYFCEDYVNGREIGVSDRFTTGWLTVMVKTDEPIGVGKVELRLSKIKDEFGESISEKIIRDIDFNIQPDWDYTYFQDKKNLKFDTPGTYKVTLMKTDGTPIVSGEVEVVSR